MCLFCDMLEGKVPMDVVRETGQSVAFRDINPQAPTHVLVIPRRHVENLGALTEYPEELADLVANTGELAGQTVFHAHLHVLGGRRLSWPPG
jgi:histidine triad (HIT) family protein